MKYRLNLTTYVNIEARSEKEARRELEAMQEAVSSMFKKSMADLALIHSKITSIETTQ